MSTWVAVVVSGIATFGIRFSFIALFGRVDVPERLERALRYVAPAVLAAIAVPAIAAPGGALDVWNPFVPAAIVGGLAAWRTRSIGVAVVVGLPALWGIQWIATQVG